VARIDGCPPGGVVVVSAPTGYGGSVLLDQAAQAARCRAVLVRAHRPDRDCDVWAGFAPALGTDPADGALGVRRALDAAQDPVLVLIDDVDDGCDGACESALAPLLADLPEHVRVVVRMFRAPHIDLSRLLARGQLVLIGPEELLLSEEESLAFLAARMPGEDPDRMRALATAAQGWIAAMTAALATAAGSWRGDPAGWLMGPGLELLLGPVVDALPTDERELLIGSAVVDVLDAGMCDEVLGRDDSAAVLHRLARRLLVVPVSTHPGSYVVHGLLSEFLRRRLTHRGRTTVTRAHAAAAGRLAERGEIDAAIFQLLEAGELRTARELLAERVGALIEQGQADRVQLLYRSRPELLLEGHHVHLLAEAWAGIFRGETGTAEANLRLLEDILERGTGDLTDEALTWLEAETLLLRAYLQAWKGRVSAAQRDLAVVLRLFDGQWDRSSQQLAPLLRIRFDLWTGEESRARQSLLQVSSRPRTGQYHLGVVIPSLGALLAAAEGRAYRSRHLAEQSLDVLSRTGRLSCADEADALLARSRACTDLAEFTTASQDAARLLHRAREIGNVAYEVLGLVATARVETALHRYDAAAERLGEARRVLRSHAAGSGLVPAVERAALELAVARGERSAAETALSRLPSAQRGPAALRVAAMGAMSEAAAVGLLQTVPPRTPRTVVEGKLMLAAACLGRRPELSRRHLGDAAAVAVDHGLLLALDGWGDELLAVAAAQALPGDPLGTLLQAARRSAADLAGPTTKGLSPGELELLSHLVEPVGNRELALALGVSVNTVKTRLRRLYAKLGVHDRASAVRAAGVGTPERHRLR
jgi:LuxR family maltose regulon positive regulatory protein